MTGETLVFTRGIHNSQQIDDNSILQIFNDQNRTLLEQYNYFYENYPSSNFKMMKSILTQDPINLNRMINLIKMASELSDATCKKIYSLILTLLTENTSPRIDNRRICIPFNGKRFPSFNNLSCYEFVIFENFDPLSIHPIKSSYISIQQEAIDNEWVLDQCSSELALIVMCDSVVL